MKNTLSITLFILFALSVPVFAGGGAGIDDYTFLRASADERAVVRTPGGELQVVNLDDEVI